MIGVCHVCNGIWSEEHIHVVPVLGVERNVCRDCLREGVHP